MKGKLIIISETHYIIVDDSEIKKGRMFLTKENIIHSNFGYNYGDRVITHSTEPLEGVGKLSLKNCQAIERGYDLDELADYHFGIVGNEGVSSTHSFKVGFQKALEILGNDIFEWLAKKDYLSDDKNILKEEYNQQTEWDVEIEMKPIFNIEYSHNAYRTEKFNKTTYTPKLDADGCLILKRV